MTQPIRRHRALLATGAAAGLLALTSCSSGGAGSSESGSSSLGTSSDSRAAGAVAAPALAQDTSAKGAATRTTVRSTSVIKTGEISLTGRDLARVRSEVDDLLAAVGGSVDRDRTTNDRQGRVKTAVLVLRVPVARFDAARKALSRLGTLKSSTQSEKDVTTQVIDTDERVQTLQNSLDRLQRFQRSAKDVRDLLRFEEQITERTAELQSMKAQQSYLADRTSLSTITLHLSTPATYVEPPGALDDAGFLAGLRGGWDGLRSIVVVALTVVGAVLPSALAVGLVGVPLFLGLRALLRRRRGQVAGA